MNYAFMEILNRAGISHAANGSAERAAIQGKRDIRWSYLIGHARMAGPLPLHRSLSPSFAKGTFRSYKINSKYLNPLRSSKGTGWDQDGHVDSFC